MEKDKNKEKQFRAWLNSRSDRIYELKNGRESEHCLKAEKDKDFTYLYLLRTYGNQGVQRYDRWEYAGIYHRPSGFIYEANGNFARYFPDIEYSDGVTKMSETITSEVRSIVEARIAEDPACLGITELSEEYQNRLLDFEENTLERAACKMFLEGESIEKDFQCKYVHDRKMSDESLMRYIVDPEGYIRQTADNYMSEHKEDILLDIEENVRIRAEVEKLEARGDSPLHRVRNIQAVLKGIDAKTLKVTIDKDGREFTFKTEIGELRRYPFSGYSCWYMPVKDRERYRELYRDKYYQPEEITEISYKGKPIYTAPPLEPEENEAEGISPKM